MEIFQKLQPVVTVLSPVVILASILFMLWMRSKFATKEELVAAQTKITAGEAKVTALEAKVDAKVNELANRCDRMNERMGEAPRAADIHKLELTITALAGEVKVLNERISGSEDLFKRVEGQVNRVESFLQEHK